MKLKWDRAARPRSPRSKFAIIVGCLLGLGLLVFAGLLVERWRGQSALHRWKHVKEMAGEILEPERIWPPPSPRSVAFSNELATAVNRLPKGLSYYAGQLSGIVMRPSGLASPGSRQVAVPLQSIMPNAPPGTWQDLAEQIRLAQPALAAIRLALSHPPEDAAYVVQAQAELIVIPNFAYIRCAAQALHTAIISDLHRGNLEAASENLQALAGFSKVYAKDPSLVTYMIRVAILGLCTDAAWDALQSSGWTEAQLAQLEQACDWDQLLAQMPRVLEGERAGYLDGLIWLRSHSYAAWYQHCEPFCASFGTPWEMAPASIAQRYYREWIFHPVWRFAWADQEQLLYLQAKQPELEVLRQVPQTGSWKLVRDTLETCQGDDHLPPASRRFYFRLPMLDEITKLICPTAETKEPRCPTFARAWSVALKNQTLGHLLRTAIALKRYELRWAKPPARLEQLAPEFIDRVPRDLMDGQPLRYRLKADGSWRLHSIGDDTEDNHGDGSLPPTKPDQRLSPWDARDWVWPLVEPARPRGA